MKNNKDRLISLIRNPKKNFGKIIPFVKSKIKPITRRVLEAFKIYKLSKPYSNHLELLEEINFKNGFFVQCGGNDGYGNDPSYYLEKVLGWKGIIIEPLPIYKLCQKNRRGSVVYNGAVGSFEDEGRTVSFVDCNAMSFVKNSIKDEESWINAGEKSQNLKSKIFEITITAVQSIIDNYFKDNHKKIIDLFIADTEGYEYFVINGLDFHKNPPSYILLEIHEDSELEKIKNFLSSRSYVLMRELKQRDFLFKKIK